MLLLLYLQLLLLLLLLLLCLLLSVLCRQAQPRVEAATHQGAVAATRGWALRSLHAVLPQHQAATPLHACGTMRCVVARHGLQLQAWMLQCVEGRLAVEACRACQHLHLHLAKLLQAGLL